MTVTVAYPTRIPPPQVHRRIHTNMYRSNLRTGGVRVWVVRIEGQPFSPYDTLVFISGTFGFWGIAISRCSHSGDLDFLTMIISALIRMCVRICTSTSTSNLWFLLHVWVWVTSDTWWMLTWMVTNFWYTFAINAVEIWLILIFVAQVWRVLIVVSHVGIVVKFWQVLVINSSVALGRKVAGNVQSLSVSGFSRRIQIWLVVSVTVLLRFQRCLLLSVSEFFGCVWIRLMMSATILVWFVVLLSVSEFLTFPFFLVIDVLSCVCVRVYMYMYVCVCVCVCVCVYAHVNIFLSLIGAWCGTSATCVRMYVCMYVCCLDMDIEITYLYECVFQNGFEYTCKACLYVLRTCFDLIACTRSTFGNGCILSRFFSFILTSNKFCL